MCFFYRAQGDVYRLQNKFEGAQHEVDRLTMDLEKANILAAKHKDEHKKAEDDFHALQEEFDSTRLQLSRTKDSEAKYKDDFERAAMDVQMLRERFEKASNDLSRIKAERDKAVGDSDKLGYDLEKATNQYNKTHNNLEKAQEEVARLQVSLNSTLPLNKWGRKGACILLCIVGICLLRKKSCVQYIVDGPRYLLCTSLV